MDQDYNASISTILETSRHELLDLSARNRLLSMPLGRPSTKSLDIIDSQSDEVYRLLVSEKKSMRFLPKKASPAKNEVAEPVLSEAQMQSKVSNKLQTSLTPEALDRQLLSLYRNAQTIIEEQGVNILYLALGNLTWSDCAKKDSIVRHAPLLIIPVRLVRQTERQQFALQWSQVDVEGNLSLQAKVKHDLGLEIPLPEIDENFVPSQYFSTIQTLVDYLPSWSVDANRLVLGFFSFAKFLMHRDLDASNWPDPTHLENALSRILLTGYENSNLLPNGEPLDQTLPVERLDYVVDADSSQTIAIERVRANESLVIQGPPGTGKSQTITNLITTAVLDGKKVLFVAEKGAALEVVLNRLQREGLDDLCLKLDSRASRSGVLESIEKTWHLGEPKPKDWESALARLASTRSQLNQHVERMHTVQQPSGLSPYQAIGALTLLGERGRGRGFDSLKLPSCNFWSKEDYRARLESLRHLAHRAEELGTIKDHIWRGTNRHQILQMELDRIRETIIQVAQKLDHVNNQATLLGGHMLTTPPVNLRDVKHILGMAQHACRMPKLDPISLSHSGWNDLTTLSEIVQLGAELEHLKKELGRDFLPTAHQANGAALLHTLTLRSKSPFRIFYRDYRQAVAELKRIIRSTVPSSPNQRVELCRRLTHYQRLAREFTHKAENADLTLGYMWRGRSSDWDALGCIIQWVNSEAEVGIQPHQRGTLALQKENRQFVVQTSKLASNLQELEEHTALLAHELQLSPECAFGAPSLWEVPLGELQARCQSWQENIQILPAWCTWAYRSAEAVQLGLGDYVHALGYSDWKSSSILDAFERNYHQELVRAMVKEHPELAHFEGLAHDRLVDEFRQLDRERMQIAKHRVLNKHYEGMPPRLAGAGYTGILLGEIQRSRGQRTLRRLMTDAGPIIQQIKPVFMMSPLSVAQYLAPGTMQFDLLIIDEASQISPIDALGAFARTRQHVVVGDQKQLPPTKFFERLTGNDEDPESEEYPQAAPARDMESILSLCCTRMPETTLRWHYRSRHHSLIAVSNREFYGNQLFIVPSPYSHCDHLGIKFHHIKDGIYDRGKSSTNRIEAKAIAQAVIAHALEHSHLSLGVAAFSSSQQVAILDAVSLARRSHPELDAFFDDKKPERFFVKNLETIQGDERDVIFISVGFGKDSSNRMTMNFGPINGENGARRLNVLISRARHRCEVFSSLQADDLRIEPDSGLGPKVFKTFLRYAETGELESASAPAQREEMSPFETGVRHALEAEGYEVHSQVGVAGFFIDLAIVDPEKPGRYLLGIECDGASYHSSLSARDRDRLRQATLEGQGWTIHRIWSTEWFQRPQAQLRAIVAAIDAARRRDSLPRLSGNRYPDSLERQPSPQTESLQEFPPYTLAQVNVPNTHELHRIPVQTMAEIAREVIAIEGPIHRDEIVTRIRELWGLPRSGQRIRAAILSGIRMLEKNGVCSDELGFLNLTGLPARPRSRGRAGSPTLRRPDRLPPSELKQGIIKAIQTHPGISPGELMDLVPKMFGYRASSSTLRNLIGQQLAELKNSGNISESRGILNLTAKLPA